MFNTNASICNIGKQIFGHAALVQLDSKREIPLTQQMSRRLGLSRTCEYSLLVATDTCVS